MGILRAFIAVVVTFMVYGLLTASNSTFEQGVLVVALAIVANIWLAANWVVSEMKASEKKQSNQEVQGLADKGKLYDAILNEENRSMD